MGDRVAFPARQPRRTRGGTRLRVLVALVVLAFVGFFALAYFAWDRQARRLLAERIEELREAGEPVSIEDLARPPVPDEDNAALDLRRAAKLIDGSFEPEYRQRELFLPLDDETRNWVRTTIEAHHEPLALVESAMTRAGVDWQVELSSPLIEILLPQLNEQRRLTRLLHTASLDAHTEGRDTEAIDRVRQLLFLSEAVDEKPFTISHLVAIAISATACDAVFQIVPELRIARDGRSSDALTPRQLRDLIDELLDEAPLRHGLQQALREERVEQLDTIEAVRAGKLGAEELGPAVLPLTPWLLTNARLMMEHTTQVIETIDTSPTWPTYERTLPHDITQRIEEHEFQHALAAILMPSYNRIVAAHYIHLADRRMAAAALAIRLHALDHGGRLPETLEALVPDYLPGVPLDPFDPDGGPLRYDPDPDRPILYSVGDNGVDNGGSERPLEPLHPPRNWWNQEDAVVHLKRHPREPADQP